jgi:predicted FMN-binding regulatory protein PaiB
MTDNSLFAPQREDDVLRLIEAQPLAWLTSGQGDSFRATLLPLRPVATTSGRVTHLVGHIGRSHDHYKLLQADGRAWALFLGPHGYIAASWMHDRTWAPTWNYASAQIGVELTFYDDPADLKAHLRDLVAAMEKGRPNAWQIEELGTRYAQLSQHIIGFRAEVKEIRAKFKLGQDERDTILEDIRRNLKETGAAELLAWTNLFNPGR